MKTNQKLLNFISKIEVKLLKENSESLILSNQSEKSYYGGKIEVVLMTTMVVMIQKIEIVRTIIN